MKYQVASKNHATGEWKVLVKDLTEEKANQVAIRFTNAETNKDIVYEAQEQKD